MTQTYQQAASLPALGSFSFILPDGGRRTMEFFYATGKRRTPVAVLHFQWNHDPGVIPEWRNPQQWAKFDPQHGWIAA
jgi:hypothetical protein